MYFKRSWSSSPPSVCSTSSKSFRPFLRSIQSRWLFQAWFAKKIMHFYKNASFTVVLLIIALFNYFEEKIPLNQKVSWALKLVFCYSRLNTEHKLLINPDSNATLIQPKPPAPHSNMGSSYFWGSLLLLIFRPSITFGQPWICRYPWQKK